MSVLILAPESDEHAKAVAWGLKEAGVPAYIWSFDESCSVSRISVSLDGDSGVDLVFEGRDFSLSSGDLIGMWIRRPDEPRLDGFVHSDDKIPAAQEWKAFSRDLMLLLELCGVRQVNPASVLSHENCKLTQLVRARRLGAKTPMTVGGNSFSRVADVFGPTKSLALKTFTMPDWKNEPRKRTYTSQVYLNSVTPASLQIAPVLIQAYVAKKREVRLMCFGQRMVAVAIASQASPRTVVDWRSFEAADYETIFSIEQSVPRSVRSFTLAYMASLSLMYCVFDYIVDECGDWIFLEANHNGQFLWCEAVLPGTPVLESFVDLLIETFVGPDRPTPGAPVSYERFRQLHHG
jgi:hypothetical protein